MKRKIPLPVIISLLLGTSTVYGEGARDPSFSTHLPTLYGGASAKAPVNMFFVLDDSGSMSDEAMPFVRTSEYIIPPNNDGSERVFNLHYPKAYKKERVGRNSNQYNLMETENVSGCTGITQGSSAKDKRNCQIWYSFYSKRALAMQSSLLISMNSPDINDWSIGWGTVSPNGHRSIGGFRNPQSILPVKKVEDNRTNFFNWITELRFPFGTPTESGFAKALEEIRNGGNAPFERGGELYSCTQNYTVLLTDGVSNTSSAAGGNSTGNASISDTSGNPNFTITVNDGFNYDFFNITSGHSLYNGYLEFPASLVGRNFFQKDTNVANAYSVNDLAFKYWYQDMRPSMKDDVADDMELSYEVGGVPYAKIENPSDPSGNSDLQVKAEWHYKNDPANWQRINTYTVALGPTPRTSLTSQGIFNLYKGVTQWPANIIINGRINGTIDDVAQAGLVGRGGFYSVTAGHELVEAFNNIRNDISSKSKPKVSSSSVSKAISKSGSLGAWYFSTITDIVKRNSTLSARKTFSGAIEDFNDCFPTAAVGDEHFAGEFCEEDEENYWELSSVRDSAYESADLPSDRKIDGNPFSKELDTEFWKDRYLITSKEDDSTGAIQTVQLKKEKLTATQIDALKPIGGGTINDIINYIHGSPSGENNFGWLSRTVEDDSGETIRNIFGDVARSEVLYVGQINYPAGTLESEGAKIWQYVVNKEEIIDAPESERQPIPQIVEEMYSKVISYHSSNQEIGSISNTKSCMRDFFGRFDAIHNRADDVCNYLMGITNKLGYASGSGDGFYEPPHTASDLVTADKTGTDLFNEFEIKTRFSTLPNHPCIYELGNTKLSTTNEICGYKEGLSERATIDASDDIVSVPTNVWDENLFGPESTPDTGVKRLTDVIDKYLRETGYPNYPGAGCNMPKIRNMLEALNDGDITTANGYDACNFDDSSSGNAPVVPILADAPEYRREMGYVITNDGQLHGFDANTGVEVFSYVPSALFEGIRNRVVNDTDEGLFNGKLSIAETFSEKVIAGKRITITRTIVVGGFGTGQKGLFALDVTTPEHPIVLWEKIVDDKDKFGNPDASNALGKIIQKPSVIQLADGTWVVAVASGVAHDSENSSLFILDLDTGDELDEIEVVGSVGLNELSPIVLREKSGMIKRALENGNLDEEGYIVTVAEQENRPDRIYAGDLIGNVWAFDIPFKINAYGEVEKSIVSVDSNSSNGRARPIASLGNKKAITTQIEVTDHPDEIGYALYFGTGEFFDVAPLHEGQNDIYVIWDQYGKHDRDYNNVGSDTLLPYETIVQADLDSIEFVDSVVNGEPTRDLSRDPNINWERYKGFKIKIPEGERVWQKAEPILTAKRESGMIFTMSYVSELEEDAEVKFSCNPSEENDKYSWRFALVSSVGSNFGSNNFVIDKNDTATKELVSSLKSEGNILNAGSILGDTSNSVIMTKKGLVSGKSCNALINYSQAEDGRVSVSNSCLKSRVTSWKEL